MPDISLGTELLLLLVAFVAGTIDAIAGGGGMLTLPALLGAGLPPVLALGTNKFQSCGGSLTATIKFYRAGLLSLRANLAPVITVFIGAVLGAYCVRILDPSLMKKIVPFVILALAVYFYMTPKLKDEDSHAILPPLAFIGFFAPLIGFYDGFIGPGTGSFFMVCLVALFGLNVRSATAKSKLLNFTSNITALVVFVAGGHVLWSVGLLMLAGQLAGGWTGAHLVLGRGVKIIKPLLIISATSLSLTLLWREYHHLFAVTS